MSQAARNDPSAGIDAIDPSRRLETEACKALDRLVAGFAIEVGESSSPSRGS